MAKSQAEGLLTLVVTLTLGALAGATAAILLAPTSGRETRDLLRRRLRTRAPKRSPAGPDFEAAGPPETAGAKPPRTARRVRRAGTRKSPRPTIEPSPRRSAPKPKKPRR